MTTAEQGGQSRRTSTSWIRVTVLWLSVVGPPLAAFAQQQLSYSLVSVACARRAPVLLHLPSLLMLAAIAAAAMYSWREWTRDDGSRKAGNGELAANPFFALLGLTMSGISMVVLLAQWLPTLFLHPCFP